jgi:hypothetical protein
LHGFENSQDGTLNGVFGILMTIWSSAFIESWKRKEKVIRYYWAIEEASISKDDERTEQFKFSHLYNDISFNKEK